MPGLNCTGFVLLDELEVMVLLSYASSLLPILYLYHEIDGFFPLLLVGFLGTNSRLCHVCSTLNDMLMSKDSFVKRSNP